MNNCQQTTFFTASALSKEALVINCPLCKITGNLKSLCAFSGKFYGWEKAFFPDNLGENGPKPYVIYKS